MSQIRMSPCEMGCTCEKTFSFFPLMLRILSMISTSVLVQCGIWPLEFANSVLNTRCGPSTADWPLQAAQADRVDREFEVHDLWCDFGLDSTFESPEIESATSTTEYEVVCVCVERLNRRKTSWHFFHLIYIFFYKSRGSPGSHGVTGQWRHPPGPV